MVRPNVAHRRGRRGGARTAQGNARDERSGGEAATGFDAAVRTARARCRLVLQEQRFDGRAGGRRGRGAGAGAGVAPGGRTPGIGLPAVVEGAPRKEQGELEEGRRYDPGGLTATVRYKSYRSTNSRGVRIWPGKWLLWRRAVSPVTRTASGTSAS